MKRVSLFFAFLLVFFPLFLVAEEGEIESLNTNQATEAGMTCTSAECKRRQTLKNQEMMQCLERMEYHNCSSVPEKYRHVCGEQEEVTAGKVVDECVAGVASDVWWLLKITIGWAVSKITDSIKGAVGSAYNSVAVEVEKATGMKVATPEISDTEVVETLGGPAFSQFFKNVAAVVSDKYSKMYCYNTTAKLKTACQVALELVSVGVIAKFAAATAMAAVKASIFIGLGVLALQVAKTVTSEDASSDKEQKTQTESTQNLKKE